eukprot:GHVR01098765.1.p1 GENE.GHVR01098765.1~~GHVR01098765.1.p1  ORF type:complete len:107 (-),score=3.34 GHVR01098765.1:898-1218(-)
MILRNISLEIQQYKPFSNLEDMCFDWMGSDESLPEVTLRLAEWIYYCPEPFRGRIVDSTGNMADRMVFWVERNWQIKTEKHLDAYTFSVAGTVGLLLCEVWEWFEG